MATVANTLKLNDQISPVMKHVLKSMQMTISIMEDLDRTAEHTDLARHFAGAKHEIAAATQALEDFEKGMQSSEDKIKNVSGMEKEVAGGFADWQKNLMAANAALSLIQQGISAVKAGAAWVGDMFGEFNKDYTAKIQLGAVMANQGTLKDEYYGILEKAEAIQGRTMYDSGAMVTGAGELATYLKDAQALEAAMDTLSMYAAGMSSGGEVAQQQMLDYATQLGKAFDGQMDGMAKRGFSFNDEQKKFLETASDMERVALVNDMIAKSWNKLDETVARSPQGVMTQFLNSYGDIKEMAGETMAPALVQLFQLLSDNLPYIEQMMAAIASAAATGIGFISTYIIPALVSGFQWIQQHADALQSALLIVGTVALIAGAAMAVAWAIAHWPIVLIIAGIAALIAILDYCGVTAEQTIDFISGLFGGLYAFVYNIVAEIYNLFVSFAEFFANFLNDPIGSIYRLFYDLVDFVLGILQTIASGIDAVFGFSLADAVSGWRNGLDATVTATFGEAEIQFDRMSQMKVIEGVKQGQKLASEIGSMLDKMPDLEDVTGGLNWGLGGNMDIGDINHVGSVGRIDDDVTISDEDIKMLKDIATLEYQVHMSQITPQFNAGDFIISEKADVDEILGYIEDSVAEALNSSLVVK